MFFVVNYIAYIEFVTTLNWMVKSTKIAFINVKLNGDKIKQQQYVNWVRKMKLVRDFNDK